MDKRKFFNAMNSIFPDDVYFNNRLIVHGLLCDTVVDYITGKYNLEENVCDLLDSIMCEAVDDAKLDAYVGLDLIVEWIESRDDIAKSVKQYCELLAKTRYKKENVFEGSERIGY